MGLRGSRPGRATTPGTRDRRGVREDLPARLSGIRAAPPPDTGIALRRRDEARAGRKNEITGRRARRGTHPSALQDHRTKWGYIFGAARPAKGEAAGLVMPWADTPAMGLRPAGPSTSAPTPW